MIVLLVRLMLLVGAMELRLVLLLLLRLMAVGR
jgi:hypothetical protein